jgi:hypothetical protein
LLHERLQELLSLTGREPTALVLDVDPHERSMSVRSPSKLRSWIALVLPLDATTPALMLTKDISAVLSRLRISWARTPRRSVPSSVIARSRWPPYATTAPAKASSRQRFSV